MTNRDDGITTAGTIPASTTVAGKSVYYITNSSAYNASPSRCLPGGDIQGITPISNGIYSGTIIPVGKIRVYCHNVLSQMILGGMTYS